MLKKFAAQVLVFFVLLITCACEHTEALWADAYEDSVKQFLVSLDGQYVVFVGEKYHYIFTDSSGVIKEILELDKTHLVTINLKQTHLLVTKAHELEGHIGLQTFDLKLSPQELDFLERLGFRNNEVEDAMEMKLEVKGKRYLPREDTAQYISILQEPYKLEIHRATTKAKNLKKIALTPLTLATDAVIFIGEKIILAPFGE